MFRVDVYSRHLPILSQKILIKKEQQEITAKNGSIAVLFYQISQKILIKKEQQVGGGFFNKRSLLFYLSKNLN